MSGGGLTDAEREGGWHVTQKYFTGLVFSEPAVTRIKADAVAAERERITSVADELAQKRDDCREAFRQHNAGRAEGRPTVRPDLRAWSDAYEVSERMVRAALTEQAPR